MNAYRLAWVAPEIRGPRWIRRRALRWFVRLAALVPLVTFLAAHELDAMTLELAVIPLLPATAIPFVRELLRFVVHTLLRIALPRRRRKPAAIAPLPRPVRDVDIWTRTHRWNGRPPE